MQTRHIIYEWDIETVIDEEVEDHLHMDRLKDCFPLEPTECLVLVRDADDDVRQWAYVTDGKLPEFFEDAYQTPRAKVPKRFHQEFAKVLDGRETGGMNG